MANPFKYRPTANNASPRQVYTQRYNASRNNLLFVIIFTLVNTVLLVTNSNLYFLFAAFFPYFIADLGMFFCGQYPAEAYEGLEGMEFLDSSFLYVMLAISIIITLVYLLAWFMSSKNRVGWLVFALIFFTLDTLGMFVINGISLNSAFDILFHAYVIYYLAVGIKAHNELKKLPAEEEKAPTEAEPQEFDTQFYYNNNDQ